MLTDRKEWQFFAALSLFAVAMGALIAAVRHNGALGAPLAVVGAIFVLLPILPPVRTAWAIISATARPPGCTTALPTLACATRPLTHQLQLI